MRVRQRLRPCLGVRVTKLSNAISGSGKGEIDIVAEHSGDLVFVEVKARRSGAFGKPEESVTEAKKARLAAAGQTYMAARGLEHSDWRIDLVAVELDRTGRAERVEVIRDAVTG